MKKPFLSAACLMLLILWPILARENPADMETAPGRAALPERFTTLAETNYLNSLALRGLDLDSQGLLIESLDGRTVFADLNSGIGFNPASVTKVATTFAGLVRFGPDYRFETAFYADGEIDRKAGTLKGDLILAGSGDPVLDGTDVSRLIRQLANSGIRRVSGQVLITGPFTYNAFLTTETAQKRMELLMKRLGIRFAGSFQKGTIRGTKVASHLSTSLRDIVFVQNAHSTNQTAERLGEAVGGPKGVEKFLIQEVGLAPTEVTISRTSGLEYNRITPQGTIALLRHLVGFLNLHNMLPEDVLPVAGIDPGTLHSRFTTTESRGAVVAKTGTLPGTDGGVSALAGVLYTSDRGPILFTIMNSRGNVNTYRSMQDSLVKDLIAECGGIQGVSGLTRRSGN